MKVHKKIKHIIQKSFLDNSNISLGYIAAGIGIILFINKISGLLKTQILVSIYGIQSKYLDMFHAANVIPELIFSIVVIGGINSALIPIFIQLNNNESELSKVFSSIINFFVMILTAFCILVFIFAPQITQLTQYINPGNLNSNLNSEDLELLTLMIRILIFSPIILCISSIFSGILQVKNAFWITALAPLFYNIGIITSSFISLTLDKNPIILALGVVFGSLLHFGIQLPTILNKQIPYKLYELDLKNNYFKQAIKNTIPRSFSLTSEYIGYIFQSFIALNTVIGTLNSLKLALSIREIPYYLFGLSVAQSIFPKLSELGFQKDYNQIQSILSKAVRQVLLWTIPCVCIIIILRTPISQLLFGLFKTDGNFEGTNMVSYALLFISASVIFISLIGIINRVFYALNDVKTPTIITTITVFIEVVLTYLFVNLFSHFENTSINGISINTLSNPVYYVTYGNSYTTVGGIALASSIALFINFCVLAIYLFRKKNINIFYHKNLIIKKIISGILILNLGFLYFKYTNEFFDTTRVMGVVLSTINSTTFILVSYVFVEKIQKDPDISIIENVILKTNLTINRIFEIIKKKKLFGV